MRPYMGVLIIIDAATVECSFVGKKYVRYKMTIINYPLTKLHTLDVVSRLKMLDTLYMGLFLAKRIDHSFLGNPQLSSNSS